MMPPPQSLQFTTRDSIRLNVLRWQNERERSEASASPILLLHGGGANAHWWDHVARRLVPQRTLYALDFRGHGDSEHPDQHEIGAFNQDLEALLGWLERDDVVLVGHSMGAAVALDHASRFPGTRGLVLVDLARGGARGSGRRARLALSLRRTYRSRDEAIDRFRFLPESSHASEALRLHIASHSIREEPDGRFGYKFDPAWFGLPPRPRPDLERIACPTLLVRGGDSALLSTDAAREFVLRIEQGRLVEVPNAGHHVMLDQPEFFIDTLMAFLSEVDMPRNGSCT